MIEKAVMISQTCEAVLEGRGGGNDRGPRDVNDRGGGNDRGGPR